MFALTLNLLGDLEVLHDDRPVSLPPSRKTRALLAYLALHTRPISRDHLCELLWELPDDPRGSLRWSLSKLRRLVDTPDRPRLVADRLSVALDLEDLDVDVLRLHRLVDRELPDADLACLEATAARYRGPFLEGLELPNLHDFHGWCLAEREGAMRAQSRLLGALVERLGESPERALPHARALVRLSPFDEPARARLVRLLQALHRPREAEQQYQLGMRLLQEAGLPIAGVLPAARRRPVTVPGTPPTSPAGQAESLAGLDPDTRDLLQWASLLGRCPDTGALARYSGLDSHRFGLALESAERLGWLTSREQGLCFADDERVDRLYATISPARRQVMHRSIAHHLVASTVHDLDEAAELAHHAQRSGDPALAAEALVTAGRLCLRFFANDEALRLARRGLALAESLPGRRRICLLLDLHAVELGAAPPADWEATAEALVGLAEQALEHGDLAHARLGYHLASHLRWAHGQWRHAREEALQSERVTRSAEDPEQIIAMAEAARCLAMLERDLDQARTLLASAEARADRHHLTHPAMSLARGLLAWHDARATEAEAAFQEARTLCKAGGDRLGEFQANEYLMMMALETGHYPTARQRCQALVALGDRLRGGSEGPFAHAAEALCRLAEDDEPRPLTAALPALRDADAKHRLAWVLNRAALLHLARRRPREASLAAEEALANAQALERDSERLLAHALLARAGLALEETSRAAEHIQAAEGMPTTTVSAWVREQATELLSRPGAPLSTASEAATHDPDGDERRSP
ncbi:BTAD domain-containing putative transcriptional regulator [Halomonas stenophila]|uniref:DNA-binding SARP family transcriptional activator n=1 Tax=Halomonas stenophila TaxID=795312 RepID=A0A7W5EW95_9GAMM|nr:BTAD domain-containing putative transcriptional regulator [Halomonas stenophila]MBB3232583.1 DNA-binding SARP family transcriptional activator [Halomonas stenophila]